MTPAQPILRRWHPSSDLVDLTSGAHARRPVTVAREARAVRFDLAATAMVVIDMQNDFCHHDGWLAGVGVDVTPAAAIVPQLNASITELRDVGVPIIWLNWGNRPDLVNLPANVIHVYDGDGTGSGIGAHVSARSTAVLTEGSWGAAIVDGLTAAEGDIHIPKYP
jgi:nicotinamidase-related amidase